MIIGQSGLKKYANKWQLSCSAIKCTSTRKDQKAKDAFSAAGNVLQSQVAIEEVKQELNKGGRGRVLFFFIIFIVNICLGKKKCRFYFETNWYYQNV